MKITAKIPRGKQTGGTNLAGKKIKFTSNHSSASFH